MREGEYPVEVEQERMKERKVSGGGTGALK